MELLLFLKLCALDHLLNIISSVDSEPTGDWGLSQKKYWIKGVPYHDDIKHRLNSFNQSTSDDHLQYS